MFCHKWAGRAHYTTTSILRSTVCSQVNGVRIIRLDNAPVNVLSRAVLERLCSDLSSACADPSTIAVVLTGTGAVFSAGLDITEMYGRSPDDMAVYLAAVQSVFSTLYPLRLPVIAAINGAAPAGGCWLSLLCDYRVMSDSQRAVIGLNEVGLGIVAPNYFREPLAVAAGRRVAERMLQVRQAATLFS